MIVGKIDTISMIEEMIIKIVIEKIKGEQKVVKVHYLSKKNRLETR
jgi:hypothetical protein